MTIEKVWEKRKESRKMKEELKNSNLAIVPKDKTGSFVAMKTNSYTKKIKTHLVEAGNEIGMGKFVEIEKDALKLRKTH